MTLLEQFMEDKHRVQDNLGEFIREKNKIKKEAVEVIKKTEADATPDEEVSDSKVTNLKFMMDGYLKQNLEQVPRFLKNGWDCVIIISGHSKVRIGKGLPLKSSILMADGSWKKIEDVKVGDKIISPLEDGRGSLIVSIVEKELHNDKKVFEVRNTNDELLYECCEEHHIPVRTLWIKTHSNGNPTEYIWKDEIYQAKDLANKNNRWYKNHCPKTITSPLITKFEKGNYFLNPYLLGLYLGNGYTEKKSTIIIADPSSEVLEWLKSNFNVKSFKWRHNCWIVKIKEDVNKFRECGFGSYNKKIPSEVLTSDFEYRKKVFEGLLDTDAYINPNGYVVYTTASKDLSEGVMNLAKTLGCRCSIDEVYKGCQSFKDGEKRKYYHVNINVGELSKELCLLKTNRLKRILELDMNNITNRESQFSPIKLIEKKEKETICCIQVDSNSGLYITDNYVVTHNSTLASQLGYYIAWLMAKKKKIPVTHFTNENIAFSPDELMRKAEKMPRNSVLIYDEAMTGLNSSRAMESINKTMIDFFTECGHLGHVIIIVLPSYFKLIEDIAIPRSLFLLDCYTDRQYHRGRFAFYNEERKEMLYSIGKKKYGTFQKYNAVHPNFRGKFINFMPNIDKELYETQKREARKRKKLSRQEKLWIKQRNACFYVMNKEFGATEQEITDKMSKMCGIPFSREAVKDGIAGKEVPDYA